MISIEDLNKKCSHDPCTCLDEDQILEALLIAKNLGDPAGDCYNDVKNRIESERQTKAWDSCEKSQGVQKKLETKIYRDLTNSEAKFLSSERKNKEIRELRVVRDEDLDDKVATRVVCFSEKNISITVPGERLEKEYLRMFVRDSKKNLSPYASQIINIGPSEVKVYDKCGSPFVTAFSHEFIGKEVVLKSGESKTLVKLVNGIAVKNED